MKKLLWLVVFQAVALISMSQSRILDSLTHELITHPQEDSKRVDLLNELSLRIFKSRPEKSLQYAQEAVELSHHLAYPKGELIAKNNLAIYYLMKGESQSALELVLEAIRIGERQNLHELLAYCYSIQGTIYNRQNLPGKALQCLNQASDLNRTSNNALIAARIFSTLGNIALNQWKNDSALIFYNKAIDVMKAANENYLMAEALNSIAIIYVKQMKNDLALDYSLQALEVSRKIGNRIAEAHSLITISSISIAGKNYKNAEELALKALALAKEVDDKQKIMLAYLSLASIKMETGKHHEAHLFMTDYYSLKDSLLNAEKNRQIAEIETRYETEKKDQTILALQQESEIQKLKQRYWFGLSLGLIVAFGVFYFLQRLHHKKVVSLLATQKILNQQLQENDLLKSKFFANISHEFRTPLSLILAPIEEKLSSQTINTLDRESFQLVKRNANRLLVLINQLLDLSKLEAKKMKLNVRQRDLKKFLLVVAASFDSLAETKKIQFQKSIQFDFQETWFDADKLEKIIYNVLFNAFKFTQAGGTVTFSIAQATNTNDLEIEIADTGRGIAENDLPHIFSPFYQSRYDDDDGQLGTGLGLSLVKELVTLHQGKIKLMSSVNRGTTITITLPVVLERLSGFVLDAEMRNVEASAYENDESVKNLMAEYGMDETGIKSEGKHDATSPLDTILIIEDNDDMRNFISNTLCDQFITLAAGNGEEGYNMAIERIPDLIISDVMMPFLNGIELSERIKNDERTSHIPIVLLTARADKDSRIEGLQKGVDDYLAKPFSMDELRVRIANLIEQRRKLAIKYRTAISSTPVVPVAQREVTLDEKFLMRASKIVEDNISDSRFGVEQMAEEINLSRAQLFRKLKALAGISPNEFINEIRLQKAARLILSKSDTLAQIGYSVGFNEQSYFAKCFRKKFGVPPSEYANKEVGQEV